jgi:hypothetical protein
MGTKKRNFVFRQKKKAKLLRAKLAKEGKKR